MTTLKLIVLDLAAESVTRTPLPELFRDDSIELSVSDDSMESVVSTGDNCIYDGGLEEPQLLPVTTSSESRMTFDLCSKELRSQHELDLCQLPQLYSFILKTGSSVFVQSSKGWTELTIRNSIVSLRKTTINHFRTDNDCDVKPEEKLWDETPSARRGDDALPLHMRRGYNSNKKKSSINNNDKKKRVSTKGTNGLSARRYDGVTGGPRCTIGASYESSSNADLRKNASPSQYKKTSVVIFLSQDKHDRTKLQREQRRSRRRELKARREKEEEQRLDVENMQRIFECNR